MTYNIQLSRVIEIMPAEPSLMQLRNCHLGAIFLFSIPMYDKASVKYWCGTGEQCSARLAQGGEVMEGIISNLLIVRTVCI